MHNIKNIMRDNLKSWLLKNGYSELVPIDWVRITLMNEPFSKEYSDKYKHAVDGLNKGENSIFIYITIILFILFVFSLFFSFPSWILVLLTVISFLHDSTINKEVREQFPLPDAKYDTHEDILYEVRFESPVNKWQGNLEGYESGFLFLCSKGLIITSGDSWGEWPGKPLLLEFNHDSRIFAYTQNDMTEFVDIHSINSNYYRNQSYIQIEHNNINYFFDFLTFKSYRWDDSKNEIKNGYHCYDGGKIFDFLNKMKEYHNEKYEEKVLDIELKTKHYWSMRNK